MANTSITPGQTRYRDWKSSVGSKDSMEPIAIVHGVGPKVGFDIVSSLFDTADESTATKVDITISHTNLQAAKKDRYAYLVDRLQNKRDIGGAVITPDGILTEVGGDISFTINKVGNAFNAFRWDDLVGQFVEVVLIASHNYIEEELGDGNSTSFRVVMNNTTNQSIRDTIGLSDSTEDTKSMKDWINHPSIIGAIDTSYEVIVGLFLLCIDTPANSQVIIPYNYEWPRCKKVTPSMWFNLKDEISILESIPRATKLPLKSGDDWLDKLISKGDTVEVHSPLTGEIWNGVRDVMSVFNKSALSTDKPILQVLFSAAEFPWLLRAVKLTALVWSVEYFKGDAPIWKYLTKTQNTGEVLKIDVRNNLLISDGVVYRAAGNNNLITVHVVFTWANQALNTRNTYTIWVTSAHPVDSALTCKVTGTYITDVSRPNPVDLNQDFVIPMGASISPSIEIDEVYADAPNDVAPQDIVIAMTPSNDNSWEYIDNGMEYTEGAIPRTTIQVDLHIEQNSTTNTVRVWATATGAAYGDLTIYASGLMDTLDQESNYASTITKEIVLTIPAGASISASDSTTYAQNYRGTISSISPSEDVLNIYEVRNVIATTI